MEYFKWSLEFLDYRVKPDNDKQIGNFGKTEISYR
jgi:hypothetical protein